MSLFSYLFGWAFEVSPEFGIMLIALMLSVTTALGYKFLTNQKELRRMRDLSQSLTKSKQDSNLSIKDSNDINSKLMKLMVRRLKLTGHILIFYLIFVSFGFRYIREVTSGLIVAQGLGYLGLYTILHLIFILTARKLLKVY